MSNEAEELMTPAEVSALARVDPKTVTRWAQAGKLTCIYTLGGHRRYRAAEVRAKLGLDEPQPKPVTRREVETMLRQGVSIDELMNTIRGHR